MLEIPKKMAFEIVIENRGYAEQSFNFIKTDKGNMLWGGRKILKPRSVTVLPLEFDPLPNIKTAEKIYILTGMRRKKKQKKWKNEIDKWEHVEIVNQTEIQEFLKSYNIEDYN